MMVPSLVIASLLGIFSISYLCWVIISSSSHTSEASLSTSAPKVDQEEKAAPWWVFQSSQRQKQGSDKDKSLKYTIYNPTSSKFEDKLLNITSTVANADGPSGLEGVGGNHLLVQSFSYTFPTDATYHCHLRPQATTSDCFFVSSIIVATAPS